jgi:hypothetical protein
MLPIVVGTSCVVAGCQDTATGAGLLGWVWIPIVVVVGIVILVVVGGLSRRGR